MNYPNQIQKKTVKTINYSNRGMNLENLINESNEYYVEKNIASIKKILHRIDNLNFRLRHSSDIWRIADFMNLI